MYTSTAAVLLIPLILSLAGCNNKKQSSLTEASLRKFYDTGLNAAATRDAQATCAQYADNAEIKMIKFTQSGGEKTTQSKAEFCQELEAAYEQLKAIGASNSARMDITDIAIAADGKSADVAANMSESVQIMGQTITSTSEQAEHIELIGGKPLITRVVSRVTGAS